VGANIGLGLANLVNIFAPDRIALGGGLMQGERLFAPSIEAALERNCRLVRRSTTAIVPAELGGRAGLAGAAAAWINRERERRERI